MAQDVRKGRQQDDFASVGTSRMLLTFGGAVGAHKAYLNQYAEAFIYITTFGGFLIGVFRDTCYLASDVNEYNERILMREDYELRQGEKNKRAGRSARAHVGFSINRFAGTVLYASWLGLIAWLTATLTYSRYDYQSLHMIVGLSTAVTLGIFVAGNTGGQTRSAIETLVAVTGTVAVAIVGFSIPSLHSIALAASIGTIVSNRTAKIRGIDDRGTKKAFFMFWFSLFLLNSSFLLIGLSQQLLDMRVSLVRAGGIHPPETQLTIHQLAYEWVTDSHWSYRRMSPEATDNVKFLAPRQRRETDFYMAEQLGLTARGPSPPWMEHLAGFMVDCMRGAAAKRDWMTYAMNRRHLIVMLGLRPLSDYSSTRSKCTEAQLKKKETTMDKLKFEAIRATCKSVGD